MFLGENVEAVKKAGTDFVHVDIMDGVYVKNIAFGPKTVSDIKSFSDTKVEVHLELHNPENYVEMFDQAGADALVFQLGTTTNPIRLLKENEMDPEDIQFSPVNLAKVIELADSGAINSTVAKEVFEEVFKHDIDPDKYVEEKGLKTVNDAGELQAVVEQVIKDNPQSVEDYHNGKEKAIGFLVGQTMKAMKGKANPGMVNKILKELL